MSIEELKSLVSGGVQFLVYLIIEDDRKDGTHVALSILNINPELVDDATVSSKLYETFEAYVMHYITEIVERKGRIDMREAMKEAFITHPALLLWFSTQELFQAYEKALEVAMRIEHTP